MWSAGCILYTMLSGYPPFMAEYVADLIEIIKNGTYDLERAPWNEVSEEAKNLVRGMLTKDPENRILPTQALKCAWLQSEEEKMGKTKMPMVMAFAINNLKLNSVKLLRKRQDTIAVLLATSFTKMLRKLTLEDFGDSPQKTGEIMKNQI
jgi:calcium-dependent protein kinase